MTFTSIQKYALLAAPWLLIPSMSLAFSLLAAWLGRDLGYVLGFAVYWLVWCLGVPLTLLGRAGLRPLFQEHTPLFQAR